MQQLARYIGLNVYGDCDLHAWVVYTVTDIHVNRESGEPNPSEAVF